MNYNGCVFVTKATHLAGEEQEKDASILKNGREHNEHVFSESHHRVIYESACVILMKNVFSVSRTFSLRSYSLSFHSSVVFFIFLRCLYFINHRLICQKIFNQSKSCNDIFAKVLFILRGKYYTFLKYWLHFSTRCVLLTAAINTRLDNFLL